MFAFKFSLIFPPSSADIFFGISWCWTNEFFESILIRLSKFSLNFDDAILYRRLAGSFTDNNRLRFSRKSDKYWKKHMLEVGKLTERYFAFFLVIRANPMKFSGIKNRWIFKKIARYASSKSSEFKLERQIDLRKPLDLQIRGFKVREYKLENSLAKMLFNFIAEHPTNPLLTIDILDENISRSLTCHFYTFLNDLNDTGPRNSYFSLLTLYS